MTFDDYLESQYDILQGILDGMGREEREAYFRSQGLTADGLPLSVELEEAADLLRTIDGRASRG